ncbi:uncharacterized protein DS421_11g346550 [Arachis hypogaea]|nr:uncharacterized protein DS421_11g346550 [Arachis hypogaea]
MGGVRTLLVRIIQIPTTLNRTRMVRIMKERNSNQLGSNYIKIHFGSLLKRNWIWRILVTQFLLWLIMVFCPTKYE